MKKVIIMTALLLGCATIASGATYTSDFEGGTYDGWLYGADWHGINSVWGVGGTWGTAMERGDGNNVSAYSGDNLNFKGNLVTTYGNQFKIDFYMKDLDTGDSDPVTLQLRTSLAVVAWEYTWSTPIPMANYVNYDTGTINALWSDSEAAAAGWTKVGTSNMWDTVTNMYAVFLFTDGYGWKDGSDWRDAAFLDDITIQTIPEPVTAIVLGVGALVALARRRRR